MHPKTLTKYALLVLTVLIADCIKEVLLHYLEFEKSAQHPYRSTLIGMAIIVAVFYPLFLLMEKLVEKTAESYLHTTKKISGGSYKGLFVALVVGLGILYCIYLKLWFNISVFSKLL